MALAVVILIGRMRENRRENQKKDCKEKKAMAIFVDDKLSLSYERV